MKKHLEHESVKDVSQSIIEQETVFPFLQALTQSKTLVIMLLVFVCGFAGLFAFIYHLASKPG